jgi:hypothetical protein
MNRYLANDVVRLRRVLGTRAGSVYAAGFALLVAHFVLQVLLGPGTLGSPSLSSNLVWLSLPIAGLFVCLGAWFMRRDWLAWSIKRNLLVELIVLAPVVLLTTVAGQPDSFSFATRPVVTALTMTFVGLLGTLLISAAVLAVRVLAGFVRGHPEEAADEDAVPASQSGEATASEEAATDDDPA